jgi:aconitase B
LPDTSDISDGDLLDVRLREGIIRNLTTGQSRTFTPISESIMELLNAGGLLQLLEMKLQRKAGL